jgi:N-acyl homoserine lactone hydrolase
MRLFGCVCGQFHTEAQSFGMRSSGPMQAPVPFYVVEHPEGITLFDCGLHERVGDPDDDYRLRLQASGQDITFGPEETVTRHLERLDIDPGDVKYVVASHLHFDHVGGLHQVPNATLVVQKREWEAGQDRELSAQYFLPRRYFDLGHAVKLVDGEHDLFGDGSVVCLPSYGHTPGHQSLRVRNAQGDHILVSDACYHAAVVETRVFPDFSDQAAMNASLDRLLAARDEDTVMVFGHDPAQWGERQVLPSLRT